MSGKVRIKFSLALLVMSGIVACWTHPVHGAVLWSDLGATLARETGAGADILGGALKRDQSSADTLYFKFHVDPLSDVSTEEYVAAFALYEGDSERLAVGNSWKAWGYSAFNTAASGESDSPFAEIDLRSSRQESFTLGTFFPYEFPRRGNARTLVFKVQYVPGGDDRITVWLNPNLNPGATEASQPESLVTEFFANASFDQIRLLHDGGGGGWIFSDMAIATSFDDFATAVSGGAVGGPARAGALPFTFRSWQREQGLPQNSVRALAQTRDGYLWIGGDEGIARFDGLRFVPFGRREGFSGGPVNALLEDNHGTLWIGAAGGLFACKAGQFIAYGARDGLPADSITALAEDAAGRLWIGTEAGLVLWQNGRPAAQTFAEQFKGRTITALFHDRENMWIGVRGIGVFQFAGNVFVALTGGAAEELLQDSHSLLVDQAGRIWIGAGDDFVLCRDGGEWRRYRIPRRFERPYIAALAEEPNGRVWAGSVSEGLFQFQDGKVVPINASSGLSDNLVQSLMVDREGKLWAGTAAGLNRMREKVSKGIAPGDDSAPRVIIEEIVVDGELRERDGWRVSGDAGSPSVLTRYSAAMPETLHLAPGKHRVEFRYTGLDFNAPEQVRFRYRMEGLDSDWVEAGAQRVAVYSYVPPGDYRFRVIACNSDGVWSEDGAAMAVTVLPHFWQKAWFVGFVALGLLGSAVAGVRFIEKRKHRRRLQTIEQERALERERARIAQDLHDDLGSSLARISLLSSLAAADKENPEQVETHVGKIAKSADETVRALEEIVWAVRPGNDSLQSLVEYIAHFANELFDGDRARCRLDLPHDLPARTLAPEVRHNIFLIVKEALTNVLKHASAREVHVQAKADAHSIEILVQDDGRGFDPDECSDRPPGSNNHNGLGNMRRRAETMRGRLIIKSARGSGTMIQLSVDFGRNGGAPKHRRGLAREAELSEIT